MKTSGSAGSGRLSLGYGAFVAALAALAVGLVAARAETYGALLGFELRYAAAAVHLLQGAGFSGAPFVEGIDGNFAEWVFALSPPLYPLLLAAAALVGLELPAQIHWVGAGFFALSVLAVGSYAGRRFSSRFLRVWTPLAAALSLPFAVAAWAGVSEPPFTLFTLLALFGLDRFFEMGRRSSLIGSAVFAALAFQTRYLGVVLPAFAGALLLLRRGAGFRERVRDAAIYGTIVVLPMAVWMARNHLLTGTLTGAPRIWVEVDASALGSDFARAVGSWTAFDGNPWFLLASGALIPLAALLLPKRPPPPPPTTPGRSPAFGPAQSTLIFGGFTLAYLGFLFVSLLLGQPNKGVEARHLFPARLPLLLALSSALDFLFRFRAGRERKPAGAAGAPTRRTGPIALCRRVGFGAAAVLLSGWAAGQVAPQREAARRANSPEVRFANGFLGEPWASSETLRFVREERAGDFSRIYSNLREATFAHAGAGFRSFRWDPAAVGAAAPGEGSTPQERLAAWLDRAPEDAWIVWTTDYLALGYRNRLLHPLFDPRGLMPRYPGSRAAEQAAALFDAPPLPRYRYRTPAALFDAPGLRPLAEFDDGAVFVADRAYTPASDRYREAYEFLRGREPEAAPDFAVVLGRVPGAAWDGPLLSYLRTPCPVEALRGRFSLHVYPEDPESLPAEGAPYGFENLDFDFLRMGVRLALESGESACVALVPLPDYGISRVRTGQRRQGEGGIWSAEVRPE